MAQRFFCDKSKFKTDLYDTCFRKDSHNVGDRIYMLCVAVFVEHTDSWGGLWLYTGMCTLAVSCYVSCTVIVSAYSLMCSYLIIFVIFTFVLRQQKSSKSTH